MNTIQSTKPTETSDDMVLDQIRSQGSLGVSDLVESLGVTATAVRQRLNRLMAQGLIEREAFQQARGRPSHRYSLTRIGHRHAGTNYSDLAQVLWEEMRAVRDPEIRQGLLKRLVARMAGHYNKSIEGDTIKERIVSLVKLFGDRNMPLQLDDSGELPVLRALACPYPELAETDHSVCAMEKMLFSEIVGSSLKLTNCRLEGADCCTFQST